ncbi:ABC transporter permease [Pseudolactococcus reticulitermitis]|uniref:ABC transmembrane type-1 domain-containing protein n=1 Tax=Pseudolactococcus reticulitermitis TaxID=2025039 RepID=A0A224X8A4_9LACT|nr:ABC transporter permease [Lactococcus reticulitermitis]GAX46474.1 hypothetical protein RsY01_53 [Lactococcus reticulitermitis]
MSKKIIPSLLLPAILLLFWQLATMNHWVSAYILPSPAKVLDTFTLMLKNGSLLVDTAISMKRVLIGFSLSFGLAFILGLFASIAPKTQVFYHYLIELMRNIPPISLIPLLILWLGIGEASKIIIIILASFFAMFSNIKKGLGQGNQQLLEVGKSLGLTTRENFFKIQLPNAVPDILIGMQIGLGYSFRAIIGAEMIASSSGLGYLILDAQQMSRSDKVIVGILILACIGSLTNLFLTKLIRKFTKGANFDDSHTA